MSDNIKVDLTSIWIKWGKVQFEAGKKTNPLNACQEML